MKKIKFTHNYDNNIQSKCEPKLFYSSPKHFEMETTKFTPGIPRTDEEVEKYLCITLNLGTTGYSLYGIYKIKRAQGMSVDDAYMATLERWANIDKKPE